MNGVYSVAQVRLAEEALMATLPDGALMERASAGLADVCASLLDDAGPGVRKARVAILAGSGNNGGDALYAGALLADRGARVTAIALSDRVHEGGRAALAGAGGRLLDAGDTLAASEILVDADLVLDGIVGIGGAGALRPLAAELVEAAVDGGALIVAVDIPSGVDADTGAVADPQAAVDADVTVTFGCLKPGLLIAPGRERSGAVMLVDIGLDATLPVSMVHVLDDDDIADAVPEPAADDYKYSRGVVGVAAGSSTYRGAALMATAGARLGGVGMVHVLDRADGVAAMIVDHFWDVVTSTDSPAATSRVTAWAVGPGLGQGSVDAGTLEAVLAAPTPTLVDADALRLLAHPGPSTALRRRRASGLPVVLTPHIGEFAALGYDCGSGATEDRLGAALRAAHDLHAVIVLKGPGTIVASPSGTAYIDTRGGPELGTAGSGDVLAGLVGSMLAAHAARESLGDDDATRIAAAGVAVHGSAGVVAGHGGRPVTAMDIIASLPDAIASFRRGSAP